MSCEISELLEEGERIERRLIEIKMILKSISKENDINIDIEKWKII